MRQNCSAIFLADVKEYANRYEVIMNLPGFSKEDLGAINIYVKEPEIAFEIRKTYKEPVKEYENAQPEEDFAYLLKEIPTQAELTRIFCLEGMTGDAKNIKAVLEAGVLTVVIPKKTEDELKKEKVVVQCV